MMVVSTAEPHYRVTVTVATVLIVISLAMLFRWHIVSSSIGVHRLDRCDYGALNSLLGSTIALFGPRAWLAMRRDACESAARQLSALAP